jgi:predicted MFS family arabinose efflux permease
MANSYEALLLGRIVAGLFGGVIGSVVLAIVTDLIPLDLRGRAMGYIQTSFAASQVLGIPAGLTLANRWHWQVCFAAIVGLALVTIIVIVLAMRPVDAHLREGLHRNPLRHLIATVTERHYTLAFAATTLMATGGYMLMPFGSAYAVHNLGIDVVELPTMYLVTGLFTIVVGPLVGRASDRFGKYPTFVFGSTVSIIMVSIYTHLGPVSLTTAIIVMLVMFVGIFSRMIPAQALMSAIPEPSQRGSFSAVSASLMQLSGGLGSVVAAGIIAEAADGSLIHFDRLGYVVVSSSIVLLIAMYFVARSVARKTGERRA